MMRCVVVVIAWSWLTITSAMAQIELKNDGFVANSTAGYQSGFCPNEGGAARFLAPGAGRQLLKVRFLFGNTTETKVVGLVVWDDTAGTAAPGMQLFRGDYQITGSANGIVESDMTMENVIVPQQFRVGLIFNHAGTPSIARDDDGITSGKNFLLTDSACNAGGPYTWRAAEPLVPGDWVIRAEISAGAVTPGDAGGIDANTEGPPTGDPCTTDAQCPLGQYCNTAAQACTYDCFRDEQCGEAGCNSLGQCNPSTGDGGGCGCRADADASIGAWLLLWFAIVGWRRRR